MGYESKLLIVNRYKNAKIADTIAEFNLCKMGFTFVNTFKDEIDFDICIDGELTMMDKYGDICRAASVEDTIKALESLEMDYRRIAPCIVLLKGFRPEEWDNLKVVHYGY